MDKTPGETERRAPCVFARQSASGQLYWRMRQALPL